MSLEAMTWAWALRLPPAPKLVLMALADEADDTGFCFPSQRRVAWKCNITERSVRRIVSTLIAARLVVVEPRFRKRARTSNGYRLMLDHPRTNCPEGVDSTVQGVRTTVSGGPGQRGPGNHHLPTIAPTTTRARGPLPDESPSVSGGLCFPSNTSAMQRRAIEKQLARVPSDVAQQILDELSGRMAVINVREPVRYATELVRRALRDAFEPELGVEIARARAAARQRERQIKSQDGGVVDAGNVPIAPLPDELRLPLERMRARVLGSHEDGSDDADVFPERRHT